MTSKIILAVFAICMNAFFVTAQDSATRVNHFNLKNNVAIKGYDPVSYFTQNTAVKGLSTISVNHKGVVYYFSTDSNKSLFIKNPSAYEPQYGGWCAYAMGDDGEKVSINPKTFEIRDGKLYLFYNAWGTNTLDLWVKEGAKNLKNKADKNWKIIITDN